MKQIRRKYANRRTGFGIFLGMTVLLGIRVSVGLAAEGSVEPSKKPPIDFATQIKPILVSRCASCHAGKDPEGGFSIAIRGGFLSGGESGPAVLKGKSKQSLLMQLVSGVDADRLMPPKGKRLSREQVALLGAWIDEGVLWPKGFRIGQGSSVSLELGRPAIPATDPELMLTNPIDRFLAAHFEEHGVDSATVVSDRVFARRVFLDLVGLLPAPLEMETFLNDSRPDKRQRLVHRLLNDSNAYATHWLTYWNDLLRNAYRGTGFIDDGRKQITGWLYKSLYDNKPYNQFVHELVNPVDGSEGFVKGIVWRGVVNASQRREVQVAQNIGQVFLGTNLKCASCHDSFINEWKLADTYGLAAVFSDEALEIHRCDRPNGKVAEIGFIFPQLGTIDAKAPVAERTKQLADLLTSPKNGRFSRTIVNRLWAKLLGRGLVEPLDEMENEPWNQDLLDWMARDLIEHGYDLKQTIERICTSRSYQLPAVGAPNPGKAEFVFRGPLVRRMSAEQFVDAVSALTGSQKPISADLLKKDGRGQGGQLAAIRDAMLTKARNRDQPLLDSSKWIWGGIDGSIASEDRLFFRKEFTLTEKPEKAVAAVSCDNVFVLFVNGKKVAAGKNWPAPEGVDLSDHLVAGKNLIAVEAVDTPPKDQKDKPKSRTSAGFIFLAVGHQPGGEAWTIGSDAGWLWSADEKGNWERLDFKTENWRHTLELGSASAAPWKLADRLLATIRMFDIPIRASLVTADPLMRALGRPNREQVVTRRDSWATMLQALELTNGGTVDDVLKKGAQHWLNREDSSREQLIDGIYQTALSRAPTAAERRIAAELIGTPATPEGVQDLLWVLAMLPEFQLIY